VQSSVAATRAFARTRRTGYPPVGINGDGRRNACKDTIAAANAAGRRGTFYLLPEHGIKGNSHMMMLDKNNLAVADAILGWLDGVTQNTADR
jgi:hypothetical protein